MSTFLIHTAHPVPLELGDMNKYEWLECLQNEGELPESHQIIAIHDFQHAVQSHVEVIDENGAVILYNPEMQPLTHKMANKKAESIAALVPYTYSVFVAFFDQNCWEWG